MADADLNIKVGVQDNASAKLKGIGANMQRMGATFRKVGIGMIAVGAAIGAGIFAMAKKFANAGDEVAKMAKRTGFAVETLSELRHVASITGTDLSSIEKATKRMSKSIIDADRGLETYARSFRELGLNIAELRTMSPEEQFWAISMAMAELEDVTMKAALAQEIFGKAGTDLLPMLAEGQAGIQALRDEAHELGVVFDEESAKAAEDFNDALQRLQTSVQGAGAAFIEDMMPTLTDFANKAVEIIGNVKDWIEANNGLAKALAIVAAVLVVGGGILFGLGMLAKAIIAINTALIIMHSLSPAGWAILAVGAGLATAAIIGMNKAMGDMFEVPGPDLGIYPGATPPPPAIPSTTKPTSTASESDGKSRSEVAAEALARTRSMAGLAGGGIVRQPTLAMIGESGPEAVVPLGQGFGQTVNVNVGNFIGDETSFRKFARAVKQVVGEDNRRNSFKGVNQSYFFGGSGL